MPNFVHLHTHSHYSLLDGLTKIPDLVRAAKARGFSALALTDYGSLYGAIEFYETCRKEGTKPIIGYEAYLAPNGRFSKQPHVDAHAPHLILLAETYEGYQNLMWLSSRGHLDGFYYKPRIDKELLRERHAGIIALSGCMAGELAQAAKNDDTLEQAKRVAQDYHELFGDGNFFIELQDHPELDGQMTVNTKLVQLSRELNIPLVVTRDVHYLNPEDAEAQDILTCIREGKTVDQPNRFTFRHVDRSLCAAADIAGRFQHVPDALENTVKIAERVRCEIPLHQWHFPPIALPEGKTADDMLREEAQRGIREKLTVTPDIQERMDYELDIITKKGYSPYFLVVADLMRYAHEHNIVATTRGSAAGSLVSYALGIVSVNPLFFRLPFERFLNPYRPSPPDIDMDYADDRRDEMLAYATEKYGVEKVAQIITFGTMMARGSVRDAGRALGFSYGFCDQVAKLIPFGSQGFAMTIERALGEEPELKKLYESNADVKRLLEVAKKIEGCARHTSIHAAGVVIAPTALTDFTPIQYETGGEKIVTQYEMYSVEAAGLLKMDFLGIRNLSILGHAVEFVEKTTGAKVDINDLPWDDKLTFEMLARGETMGVFQLGGSGMTRYLKELRPSSIFDIMAMVALFRPGPMESIPEYIRRKHNPSLVTYPDPRLEKILDRSYGVITYQDDVLLTAMELAGYNWEEVDKFRKAIGKKIPAEMAKQKIKFFQGCRDHGQLTEEKIEELWQLIEPFAAYGFNKCLTGDTRIMDPRDGSYATLAELFVTQKKGAAVALQKNYKLHGEPRFLVIQNGVKSIYALQTRSGRRIRATANHPFLKFEGWTRLDALRVGDRIAVPRTLPTPKGLDIDPRTLRVLGYLIAEGNLCHPHGVYFYSTRDDEIEDFIRAVQVFSNVRVTVDRSKSAASVYVGQVDQKKGNELMRWLKQLGLFGKKATEKKLPASVYQLNQDELSHLIAALWQGDGSVQNDAYGQIFYATSSPELAGQLQHLLLRLSILSTIHHTRFNYRGGYKYGYRITVSQKDMVEQFARTVGRYLLKEKKVALGAILLRLEKIYAGRRGVIARGTKDTIPIAVQMVVRQEMVAQGFSLGRMIRESGLAERLFHDDLRRIGFTRPVLKIIGEVMRSNRIQEIAGSDVYWDEIVSITPAGKEMTYNLEVPGSHNFVANDIIVHNSHAASYAVVAHQTAYLKAHYPVQFMTAILTAEAGDMDKVAAIAHECERMGIAVLPPDVNESFRDFAMIPVAENEQPRIRFGLNAIKNLGAHIADVIYRERKERGQYTSLDNFLLRIQDKDLNKKSLESLIKCGAMGSFGHDRGMLLANTDTILSFHKAVQDEEKQNQHSLFGEGAAAQPKLTLAEAPPAAPEDTLAWEKELLGLYVSAHPFDAIARVMEGALTPVSQVAETGAGQWVIIGGVLAKAERKITKKGDVMLFVTLEDKSGAAEMLVFPRLYQQSADAWKEGAMLCVMAKTSKEEGDNKLFAEKVYPVSVETAPALATSLRGAAPRGDEAIQPRHPGASRSEAIGSSQYNTAHEIHISITGSLGDKRDKLRALFEQNPGTQQVCFDIHENGATKQVKTRYFVEWEKIESEVGDVLSTTPATLPP